MIFPKKEEKKNSQKSTGLPILPQAATPNVQQSHKLLCNLLKSRGGSQKDGKERQPPP
jgi:hypothetical protein